MHRKSCTSFKNEYEMRNSERDMEFKHVTQASRSRASLQIDPIQGQKSKLKDRLSETSNQIKSKFSRTSLKLSASAKSLYQKLINIGQSEQEKNIFSIFCDHTQRQLSNYLENTKKINEYDSDMLILCTDVLIDRNKEKIKRYVGKIGNYLKGLRNEPGLALTVYTTISEDIDINDPKISENIDQVFKKMINNTKVVLLCVRDISEVIGFFRKGYNKPTIPIFCGFENDNFERGLKSLINNNTQLKISKPIILFIDSSSSHNKKKHFFKNIERVINIFCEFIMSESKPNELESEIENNMPSTTTNVINNYNQQINYIIQDISRDRKKPYKSPKPAHEYQQVEEVKSNEIAKFVEPSIQAIENKDNTEVKSKEIEKFVEPSIQALENKDKIVVKSKEKDHHQKLKVDSNERLEIIKDEFKRLTNEYTRPYFIDGFQTKNAYICVKTPTYFNQTVMDYWHMIWKHQVFTIVHVDDHINQPFWPIQVNHMLEFDNDYSVKNCGVEVQRNFIITVLILTKSNSLYESDSRKIMLFQYLYWPEKGVPDINIQLIQFFQEISLAHQKSIDNFNKKRTEIYEPNPLGVPIQKLNWLPICVNCSTGFDNSATFCAISISFEFYHSDERISVARIVENIRRKRLNAISNFDQFYFIYEMLKSYDNHVRSSSF